MKQFDVPAIVEADPEANATDLLIDRVAATPDMVLFGIPEGEEWRPVTAKEFLDQVEALAKGFIDAGIQPGDKIGLMCKTRYEWTLIDFAVWFAGAMLVPVYETSSPEQVAWNLTDSGAVAIIVESPDHFARFDEVHADLPAIRNVWQLHLGDLDKLATAGADVDDDELTRRRKLASGSDVATIIYTSGSTGRPKGCVLTHSNFVELSRNAVAALNEVVAAGDASTLLFIPTAHVFARFIAVMSVHAGVKVGHQPDTSRLLESLASFKPTFLLAVPRVFEKVYNSAEQKAEASGRGKIFAKAVEVAIAHSKAKQAGSVPLGLSLRYTLYNALVYGKLRAAIGGRVRYAISGSAPLGDHLGHFFHSLGILILEGYGLTETTAPVTVNLPSKFKIGTVGPALPGVSVRTADDGEIEAKGICVFAEYWNDPESTAASFEDGWFKTGDLGTLDDDGYLSVTGRKKELIVTASGKNVAPAPLEDSIRAHPLVGQVVVVGDRRPFVSALITLDPEMLPIWLANNRQPDTMSLAEAATNAEVTAEIQRAVDAANVGVSRAESIRKFAILPIEFTQESGHLTPKLSIKRHVIVEDFADDIDSLYAQAPPTQGTSLRH